MDYTQYEALIRKNCWTIEFVPEEYRTYPLCLVAVRLARKRLGDCRSILGYIPKRHFTQELCSLALERNGDALRDIPEAFRTPELCRIAVRQNGEALSDVPQKYRTKELCQAAVQEFGMAIAFVPREFIDQQMAYTAILTTPRCLPFIPEECKTLPLCEAACRRYSDIPIHHIPQTIWDQMRMQD